MLYYDRIDLSQGIDVNNSFKFQLNVCNRCHDLLIISINLNGIAILNINSSDYCCLIRLISENEAINLMQTADFTQKKRKIIN